MLENSGQADGPTRLMAATTVCGVVRPLTSRSDVCRSRSVSLNQVAGAPSVQPCSPGRATNAVAHSEHSKCARVAWSRPITHHGRVTQSAAAVVSCSLSDASESQCTKWRVPCSPTTMQGDSDWRTRLVAAVPHAHFDMRGRIWGVPQQWRAHVVSGWEGSVRASSRR
jgi:hypothetical protein